MKKALSLILAVLMLLGLCACTQPETNNENNGPEEPVVPSLVYDTWYSYPEVGVDPITVKEDGTCIINNKQYNWVAYSIEADKVILIAGEGEDEYTITFTQLDFAVPMMSATGLGVFIQYEELWKYIIEWYAPETGETFNLSFYEMAQAGCKLTINGSDMTVEVVKDGVVTHTIELSDKQAIVTDAEGNSTTFELMN